MFGTEFIKGQGLGNQLFCYASARSVALDLGYEFGTANQAQFACNIHSDKGMYFMDVDLGKNMDEYNSWKKYYESEERIWIKNSVHDITNGCYISAEDPNVFQLEDNTLLYGNLQSEKYFVNHREELKNWLHVKKEYESFEYTRDNLCIMNMRGGEYIGARELYLQKKYWVDAMNYMRGIVPNMKFMIVTEDVKSARVMFPDIPSVHFDIAGDYITIKNAKYLIVSNSSFACFPVFTSDTCKVVIAPKYWARHNVSTGYWASEQNIYGGWLYLDRNGKIFSANQCKEELVRYKQSEEFENIKKRSKPKRISLFIQSQAMVLQGYWHMIRNAK